MKAARVPLALVAGQWAAGLWAPAARAGAFEDSLAAVEAALAGGDPALAARHAAAAQRHAEQLDHLVSRDQVARVFYLRGVAAWKADSSPSAREPAMQAWRQALGAHIGLVWEPELIADAEARDLFEALRQEVGARPGVDPGVPERTGEARVFIDGQRRLPGEQVLPGLHLGQVQCPSDTWVATWSDFSRPVKWLKLCPSEVDTSVVVEEAAEGGDWFDLGDAGDAGDAGGAGDAGSVGDAGDASAGASAELSSSGHGADPTPSRAVVPGRARRVALLGGAGGAMAASLLVYRLSTVNRMEASGATTAALQDDRSSAGVAVAAGLFGVATGLAVTATLTW